MERETAEAWTLGAVGLAKGLFELWNEQPAGDKAWQVILGGVAIYEMVCPKGELLSESADRFLERHQRLGKALIYYTAAHIANDLPDRGDLFHQFTKLRK